MDADAAANLDRVAGPAETVWVVSITHRHGNDMTARRTEAGARRWVANFAREWWDDLPDSPDRPRPEEPAEDDDAIRVYFDTVLDEYFDIEQVVLGD